MAQLADGAIFSRYGATTILTTAVSEKWGGKEVDFMPLSVEFREKSYAARKIPRTYTRRETGTSDSEVLNGRVVDRALRPLFPSGYFCESQIINTITSYDGDHDVDVLSINSASAALSVSDIPWDGPVGAVRIGCVNGKLIVNPNEAERKISSMNLLYAGNETRTLMIECQGKEVPEDIFSNAMQLAQIEIQPIINIQKKLKESIGKPKRPTYLIKPSPELAKATYSLLYEPASVYFGEAYDGKQNRNEALNIIRKPIREELQSKFPDSPMMIINMALDAVVETAYRDCVLRLVKENDVASTQFETISVLPSDRPDGRNLDEVRKLEATTSVVPLVHGSSIFRRGDTSTLCVVTLGYLDQAQRIESYIGGTERKVSFLQYEFPPYCVNEIGKVAGVNRRAVGHGALAEKALQAVLPPERDFPYSYRINSEVLSSDGSSSMATVCGGSLALMDAGVPIKTHVAGISMGLVTKNNSSDYFSDVGKYAVLTDILGMEDHYGDMDFKVAGTINGITGVQLDVKLPGVPVHILCEAIIAAKKARGKVLQVMNESLSTPRPLRDTAMAVEKVPIKKTQRGIIYGPGGSTLKRIESSTGAVISFRQEDEYGEVITDEDPTQDYVFVYAPTIQKVGEARRIIESMTYIPEVGGVYNATVTELREYGALVLIGENTEGLVHVSELDYNNIEGETYLRNLKIGDVCQVKCTDLDERTGKLKLSRKALLFQLDPDLENNLSLLRDKAFQVLTSTKKELDEEKEEDVEEKPGFNAKKFLENKLKKLDKEREFKNKGSSIDKSEIVLEGDVKESKKVDEKSSSRASGQLESKKIDKKKDANIPKKKKELNNINVDNSSTKKNVKSNNVKREKEIERTKQEIIEIKDEISINGEVWRLQLKDVLKMKKIGKD